MGILIGIREALSGRPDRDETVAAGPFPHDPAFAALVDRALDDLPEAFTATLANTAVVIAGDGAAHGAYGLYHGPTIAGARGPAVVVLYEDTLTRDFGADPERLAAEVERTLRHELAHHLGFGERAVSSLGL